MSELTFNHGYDEIMYWPEVLSTWIDTNYKTYESALNKCAEATLVMQEAFPKLTRHKGYCNGRPHWWLKDGDKIVDPTWRQFELPLNYVEWVGEEPYGKCLNCGDFLFRSKTSGSCCCSDCEEEYISYLRDHRNEL